MEGFSEGGAAGADEVEMEGEEYPTSRKEREKWGTRRSEIKSPKGIDRVESHFSQKTREMGHPRVCLMKQEAGSSPDLARFGMTSLKDTGSMASL